MTFLRELINILNRGQLREESRYKSEKVNDFFKIKI